MISKGRELLRLVAASFASGVPAAVSVYDPVAGAVLALAQPAMTVVAEYGINRVSGVAAAESGLTGRQIAERLQGSEEGLTLLVRAFNAAQTAVLEEKLQALGRCLAAGVEEHAVIDEEVLLVGVITALETYHLRVLKVMANDRTIPATGDPNSIVLVDRASPEQVNYWSVRDFAAVDPDLPPYVVESLIGPMLAQSVITSETATSGGLGSYVITRLGRRLLERVLGQPHIGPSPEPGTGGQ
jgi:hypothetical protein